MIAQAYRRTAARPEPAPTAPGGRSRLATGALLGLAAFGVFLFGALGVWQLERRVWKLALIARVEARVHAVPTAAPGPAEWPHITRQGYEYRRISARGRFLRDRETLVRAVTELGGGYWVMTPLRTDRGFVVLVNRGFVPSDRRDAGAGAARRDRGHRAPAHERAEGRLPAQQRSPARSLVFARRRRHRGRRGLHDVAPYFLDAQGPSSAGGPGRGVDGHRVSQQPFDLRADLVHAGGAVGRRHMECFEG